MKFLAPVIILLLWAPPGRCDTNVIGQLPEERVAEPLQARERNPFTRRETKVAEVQEDKESEESRLRGALNGMRITGVIRGGGAIKVLLGELIIKIGARLPPIIENQSEELVVSAITDKLVEIDFVEKESRAEPRKILIPIDLKPKIRGYIAPVQSASRESASDAAVER